MSLLPILDNPIYIHVYIALHVAILTFRENAARQNKDIGSSEFFSTYHTYKQLPVPPFFLNVRKYVADDAIDPAEIASYDHTFLSK